MIQKSGVLIVPPTATIAEALENMVDAEVGSVLVSDPTGDVVGIITERDVLKHWKKLSKEGFSKLPVTKIMTQPVFCLLSHEIHKAVLIMLDKRIRHIPILGGNKELLGIMSIRDVLRNYQLYSLPQNSVPTLNPIDPGPGASRSRINLLCPTAGLEKILDELFGVQIEFKTWQDGQEFVNSKFFQELGNAPLFVDLDGIAKQAWQNAIKTMVSSQGKIQPRLFVILNPSAHSAEDIDTLKTVAAKLSWHVYSRPVPIAALINDLAALRLPR